MTNTDVLLVSGGPVQLVGSLSLLVAGRNAAAWVISGPVVRPL